jgi:hypothetical protein
LVTKLNELKIDYLISNVSIKNQIIRKESIQNFTIPIFLNDYSLLSYEWKNKFIGKTHDEDINEIKNNYELIKMDMDYCNHIGSKFIITKIYNDSEEGKYYFAKIIKRFILENPDKLVNVIVSFSKQGLQDWNRLQSELGSIENLGLILDLHPDLPDEVIIKSH